MEINEPIILRTWKGNKNGSILITLPNKIIREYNLEKPTHLILERQTEGIFLRKLPLDYQTQKLNSEQQILSSERNFAASFKKLITPRHSCEGANGADEPSFTPSFT